MIDALDSKGENLLRELAPRVLAAVVRRFGEFDAAEDAVQEALLAAAMQWPRDGIPENPGGWLIQVAARRCVDQLRADLARRRREAVVMTEPDELVVAPVEGEAEHDDTLLLLFMCCHPALTRASAIALTLRAVGGLTTAEIASAFLVPEPTMAQRISRAKQKIKASGLPFQMPEARERAERLGAVLHVLYLIFSEGYTTSAGASLQRTDLSREAIRLTRAVHEILPDGALNHAIARAMVDGPAAGLKMLDALESRLAGHHRLHAVRAHLLEMWGDREGAIAEYRIAARRTASLPEQRYLLGRAAGK